MWKFVSMINFFGSLLLASIFEIATSTSPENVSHVEKAINLNFDKTNGDHLIPNLTLNRANYSHTITVPNNSSDLTKPPNDKNNLTRTFTTYEVQEPGKKHSEREVKIVYEASKSSASVLPKGQDIQNVPYNYNTSIKYSSKYSLIPQESKHVNTSENTIDDNEEDYDEEEEGEEEEAEEDEDEVEEKKLVEEKIRENERKIKKFSPISEKPRGTYEEEKRKRLQTEKLVINRAEEIETKPRERFTEKPQVIRYTTERPVKYKKEREELTEKPPVINENNIKYIPKPAYPKPAYPKPFKSYKTEEDSHEHDSKPENHKMAKYNPVRPEKARERKSGFPGNANYIITSSAKIGPPRKPKQEHDLKNEQSQYYWRDRHDEDEEDEDDRENQPLRKNPILSLKVLPTEPVKILEEEIMATQPYDDPRPISFSSVVFNPSDRESTSELSGSYYDKTPNVPNVIRERIDEEEEDEEEEASENLAKNTKSVPYTTPNYQSIQTPLNQIKFVDTYAYLNPFAEGKNNFPYKYENEGPKITVYDEKPPVEDVPFRANLFPQVGVIEKPVKPFTLRPELELRHPVQEQSINEYRLSAEELRQREKDRVRNQNDIAENEFEQRKPTPPSKTQYLNNPKIKTENNEDESSEYRPKQYKQTKLISKPELSDVEEQYTDRGKHHSKAADLFNYNVSSTRPRYPHKVRPNVENGEGESENSQRGLTYAKPRKNYREEGYSHPAASNSESNEREPNYNSNRPPQPNPYRNNKNKEYPRQADPNPENDPEPKYNPNRPHYPKPYRSYKNESSRALFNSHLNNIKESNERVPVTRLPKPKHKNEEENIYSRRPQKFTNGIDEDVFPTPELKSSVIEDATKSDFLPFPALPPIHTTPPFPLALKDSKNAQTEIREPVKDNFIEPVNNIFSPAAKLNFESLDENDDMYQQILSNIESIFGIRTSSLLPVTNEKETFIPKPIIPVDYQPYLQPHFEGNSYENLKKKEEDDDDNEENRSEESDEDNEELENEEEESDDDRREDDDEDQPEDSSDYNDASDDGSESNSNVQKVRSTDRPKSKRKSKKKYKFSISKGKPNQLQPNHLRNEISEDKDKSEEWEEEIRNTDEDASIEVTTASYNNVLTSRPVKSNRKPKYPPQSAKLIIKDVHSSPVDQKVIRVIVPKIIMKDSVAIPTHSKIIIRKENAGF